MSRTLGMPGAQPATRATSPGWRDPRLWVGVLIVAVSVVAGARLVGAADDSVVVWAVAADMGAGDLVAADDLVGQRVRFADGADLDRYFTADEELPADLQLLRGIGDGELLPRAAVGPAGDGDTRQLPIAVDTALVPASVRSGSTVDVYLTGTSDGEPSASGRSGRPVLEAVTVIDAPALAESLAVSGQRQLVLAVTDTDAARFFRLVGTVDVPTLTIVRRG